MLSVLYCICSKTPRLRLAPGIGLNINRTHPMSYMLQDIMFSLACLGATARD